MAVPWSATIDGSTIYGGLRIASMLAAASRRGLAARAAKVLQHNARVLSTAVDSTNAIFSSAPSPLQEFS